MSWLNPRCVLRQFFSSSFSWEAFFFFPPPLSLQRWPTASSTVLSANFCYARQEGHPTFLVALSPFLADRVLSFGGEAVFDFSFLDLKLSVRRFFQPYSRFGSCSSFCRHLFL